MRADAAICVHDGYDLVVTLEGKFKDAVCAGCGKPLLTIIAEQYLLLGEIERGMRELAADNSCEWRYGSAGCTGKRCVLRYYCRAKGVG